MTAVVTTTLFALLLFGYSQGGICPTWHSACDGTRCIRNWRLCNGVPDCEDGADEAEDFCRGLKCADYKQKCADGLQCLQKNRFCDNKINCHDASDESAAQCGVRDCEAGRFLDEKNFCQKCPKDTWSSGLNKTSTCTPCPSGKGVIAGRGTQEGDCEWTDSMVIENTDPPTATVLPTTSPKPTTKKETTEPKPTTKPKLEPEPKNADSMVKETTDPSTVLTTTSPKPTTKKETTEPKPTTKPKPEPEPKNGAGDEGGFTYEGQRSWGATCANKTGYQSPINIHPPEGTVVIKDPLTVPEASKNVTMTVAGDDEHSVKVLFPESEGGQFEFKIPTTDGVKTKALQLHLHWGASEHMIDFKWYRLECHLVTARQEGQDTKLTVFARVFDLGEANPAIEQLIKAAEDNAMVVEEFDLTQLYTSIRHVFTYTGSLTTPPCTEGVSWFVVQDSLTVSEQQVARLKNLGLGNSGHKLKSNYRYIQAINDRNITRYDLTGRAKSLTVSWLCFFIGVILISL